MLYVIFLNYKTTKSLSKTIWLYLLKSNPVHRLPALLRGCTRPTRALNSKSRTQDPGPSQSVCQITTAAAEIGPGVNIDPIGFNEPQ